MDALRAENFQPAAEHLGSAIFGDLMKDYERRVFDATVASATRKPPPLMDAGVDVDAAAVVVCVDVDMAAQPSAYHLITSSLTTQTLKSYAGTLSQFAEFCHDSENISPLEATTATVVRYVAWIGVHREGARRAARRPDNLRMLLLLASEDPRVARLLHHFIDNVQSAPLASPALAVTNF
eukprot:jgi/Tetstr1/463039/TSEL_007977.t1